MVYVRSHIYVKDMCRKGLLSYTLSRFLWFKSLCSFEVWCSVVQSFAKIKFSSFIFQKYFDFLQPTQYGYAKS